MSRLPSALLVPFVLLAVVGLGLGATLAVATSSEPGPTAATTTAPSPTPESPPATPSVPPVDPGSSLVVPEGETSDDEPAPVAVRVPGLGIDSSLEDLQVDDAGRLESPRRWQRAGWFADGTRPGAVGPAVVAGHVDSPTGPAVFARLGELGRGDRVQVERQDGSVVTFEVDRTAVVGKDDFPTEEVYGPTPDAQLRLITCDGPYVRSSGGYQANLVVWATEVAA